MGVITVMHVAGLALSINSGRSLTANDLIVPVWYAFALVGALIVLRGRATRVAWYCLAIGLAWALDSLFFGLYFQGVAHPGTVPRPEVWAVIADPLWVFSIFAIATFIPLYFPDGELPSPRWRWLPRVIGAAMLMQYPLALFSTATTGSYGRPAIPNPLLDTAPGRWVGGWPFDPEVLATAIFIPVFVGVALCVAALVIRYRRATGVERQQLRWLAVAGSTAILGMVAAIFLADYVGDWVGLLAGTFLVLIPISIGVAVFRYRLYDVDRVISRTIGYVLIVTVLAGVFAGLVVGIQALLPAQNDLAVAASTLAVAALFNPLRRRVQLWVDKRFNRSRYDAQSEIDSLSTQLRNAHDIDEITGGMLKVVAETMQPSTVRVWLREGP